MEISNAKIAKLLRNVAAAYTIKGSGNIFQIRAYENAADSIEHSTSEMHDLWQEEKLSEVPALGEKIREYLDELFKTGHVRHFNSIQKGIPTIVFNLLDIPGVGPKTAHTLSNLGVKSIEDLKDKLKSGYLVQKGFSVKTGQNILDALRQAGSTGKRMLLPYAFAQAEKILNYLKKCKEIIDVHPLGSLRRMVATVGDLDFSASSKEPKKVIEYFCKMPGVARIVDQGEAKATIVLQRGIQVDLLVGRKESYGALLQHFTGSKSHNIKLRTYALEKGYSLSEYGVRRAEGRSGRLEGGKLIKTETEEEFYKLLGMQVPPPEIREDTGEIEAALRQVYTERSRSAQGKPDGLPKLVELKDIKGDLHLHSNYPIDSPSHAPGANSTEEIIQKAKELGYQYVGISDHPPGFSTTGNAEMVAWVQKRTKFIHRLQRTKGIRVLNGLEIDILPDGRLSVPDEALNLLDYCIAGIHSGHRGHKETITKRILSALNNPHVDIISHPTNRLLNERESSDADWPEIFKTAAKNNRLLEINAFPNRLDLRDDLVREAIKYGVKFIINTDAHEITQMDNMRFGVSVARRGWATAKDVVNTWGWTDLTKWLRIE